MSILTKNTVKGIAFDLVTEYLESYSGQKHFTHNSKKGSSKTIVSMAQSSLEEIISNANPVILNQIPANKHDFLNEEILRGLISVYTKEFSTEVV